MLIISYCNIIILGEELIYILIVCINKAEFCNGRDRPIKRVNIGYGFVNCVKLSYFQSLLYWFERTIKFSTVVTTIVIYIQREILHPTGHGTHNVYILSMFSLCQCCPCTSVFFVCQLLSLCQCFFSLWSLCQCCCYAIVAVMSLLSLCQCFTCVKAILVSVLLQCQSCPCTNIFIVSILSLYQCCYIVSPVLYQCSNCVKLSLCQCCYSVSIVLVSMLLQCQSCPCTNIFIVSFLSLCQCCYIVLPLHQCFHCVNYVLALVATTANLPDWYN